MALSPSELRRYSRHLSLTEIGLSGQEKLRAARVLIVGAGGLGSPAALYLAAAGIGTLGLVDFDRVDESNLQRQVLFDTAQVGIPKTQAASARLTALNPQVQVLAHPIELRAANVLALFDRYDLIVDGSDRMATHYLINDACVLTRKPLVSAAIYRFEGQLMTYVPDRGPCYRCLFPHAGPAAAPNCAEVGVLGVLPGVLGTLQATEAIKLIAGIGTALIGRLLTYDALELRFHELRAERRTDCAVCGEHPSITAPFDAPDAPEVGDVPGVSARQLAQQLGQTVLIDVREPHEFAAGHLAGALNLPLSRIEHEGLTLADPERVVFVCRSGVRSAKAARTARASGYASTRHLEGGLLAWRAQIDPALELI
jgi:molybdopterin/thiamine biosynthesis adenylyltransferase/rhodanese-related sulfurtransferase